MTAPRDWWHYRATVAALVDADTLDLDVDLGFRVFTRQRVRLEGIDAPERHTPAGLVAVRALERLVPVGTRVVVATAKADRYGRWLARVAVSVAAGVEPIDVATWLLDHGHARRWT